MIPYARQSIDDDDVASVVEVLRSDWLTQGPAIERFEHALTQYCGAAHAVVMSSATAALHAACAALDLGPSDTLWTSANSFVASANCALYCGASVDFVDIDPRTYNMSVEDLERKLVAAQSSGTLPKIVLPVHFAGQPADMEAIAALARRYGFKIIEDASHAIGAADGAARVGACRYADVTVFSFHPVKIITTGEGGAALTNDVRIAQRLALFRSHGITRDPSLMEGTTDGPWAYEQIGLGYNYRMTDIQAALGHTQLARIDAFIERRRGIAALYDRLLADMPIGRPWRDPRMASAFHLYPVRVPERRRVFEALQAEGIRVNVHYMPIYLQPYYRHRGFAAGYCPQAERYYSEAISLPMYVELRDEQVERVALSLKHILAGAVGRAISFQLS